MPESAPNQLPASSKRSVVLSPVSQDIVKTLQIAPHLMDRASGLSSLLRAYEQWKAYYEADAAITALVNDGTWAQKPPGATIIEIFVAKSTWYKSYVPAFSSVGNYPELLKWLNQDQDALSGAELFGVEKPLYTFSDIMDFYARAKVKKEKRKAGPEKDPKEKSGKRAKKAEKGKNKAGSSNKGHGV
jgi:hypothetical protein